MDQEGKPRRHPVRDETAPYANPTGRIDWITQITQDGSRFIIDNPEDSGGLTAGARVAVLRHSVETGAVVKVQGTVTAVDQAGVKSAVTGPWANQEDLLKDVSAAEISRLLGVSRNTVYRSWGRAGNAEQRPRPTSPRPVWPLRRAMTSQTNPHGWTGDPEARWGADFGDSAPAHRGFPGEHPVPRADAGEPVTSRGKRALTAGDELHDAGELGQLPQDLAETPAETFSRGKAAPETLRRHDRPVNEEIIIVTVQTGSNPSEGHE